MLGRFYHEGGICFYHVVLVGLVEEIVLVVVVVGMFKVGVHQVFKVGGNGIVFKVHEVQGCGKASDFGLLVVRDNSFSQGVAWRIQCVTMDCQRAWIQV